MAGRLKTLLCLLFLFFNFLNASAQCTNLDIVASKTDACAPEVIMYYVTNAPDGSLFEWEIAGNKFFGRDTIYQSHIDPASFMPKATISMLDGTICHITGKEQITIHGSPVPLFSVQPTLLCDGPGKSQLTDITPNTQARNWIVDGDNYSNTPVTIEHDFFTLGKKTISLIVTDIFGDPKISVPWAFTPNGDGLNDGFSPQTKYFNDGTIIGDFTFSIYNRWGEKIYETTLRSDSWDGTYQGEMCQQGVYVYKIKAKSLVGKIFNEKGTDTLLR